MNSAYELPALAAEAPGVAEAVVSAPESGPATPVRAENFRRSLFHVASGLVALALLRLLPDRAWLVAVSGALAGTAWTLELSRRRSGWLNDVLMRFFAPIAHPQERHKVNSSTWYMTALVGLALLAPLRSAEIAVVVLAFADPAAGFVGRRIGRTRIRAGRSLEGTLAFVIAGVLAALAVLTAFHALPLPSMLLLAGAGAAAGAVAEVISTRLDDNFTIPVTVAIAASAAALALPGV